MIKKTIIAAAIIALGLGFVFGRNAISYVSTSISCVRDSARDMVPVPMQIKHAKKVLAKIDSQERQNQNLIIREEYAVERLAKRIAALEEKQESEQENILRMQADLKSGNKYIYYANHRYSSNEVRVDLESRFNRFKVRDSELSNLRKQLAQQEKIVKVAREKLSEMQSKKSLLATKISELESKHKMLAVTKSASEIPINDSAIANLTDLVGQIDQRMEMDARMLETEVTYVAEIQLDEAPVTNVCEEIACYFDVDSPAVETLAEAEELVDPQL